LKASSEHHCDTSSIHLCENCKQSRRSSHLYSKGLIPPPRRSFFFGNISYSYALQIFLSHLITATSQMHLREIINPPRKLQDEMAKGKKPTDPRKPAFPRLLQSQVVSFNPHLPPAAFPSLALPTDSNGYCDGDGGAKTNTAVDIDRNYDGRSIFWAQLRTTVCADHFSDDNEMNDADPFPTGCHTKTRRIPTFSSPIDPPFEDEMASSEDDDGNVESGENSYLPSRIQAVKNRHLDPQVRTRTHKPNLGMSSSRQGGLTMGISCRPSRITVWTGRVCALPYNWPLLVKCRSTTP
jgi:hypothetical protein